LGDGAGVNRFPIRVRILLAVVTLLTVTVAAITASMARIFSEDKTAYVNDVAAIIASGAAAESATLLRGYLHGMGEISMILADSGGDAERRERIAASLFTRLPDFIGVSLVTDGLSPTTLYDRNALASLKISGEELLTRSLERVGKLSRGAAQIGTLSLPGTEPLLVIASPLQERPRQKAQWLLACIRTTELARAVSRGRGFRTALVDSGGEVLIDSGARSAEDWTRAMFELGAPAQAGVVTREFTAEATEYIGARAALRVADVTAITAIPRAAAYLTARRLLDNLMVVSLALIASGALVALLVSRRLTRPIAKLVAAAEGIGQGKFDIRIPEGGSDEIGMLASTFNSMASGLQERERALAEAQQALVRSEKMSAFGQLSAGIAHEVRNPLAGILGHTQLLMRRVKSDDPAMNSLDLIARETRRCSDIIANLMRFARQDKPHFLPLEINAVVDAALSIVDHQLSLHGIGIVREAGQQLPPVSGDFNQLQQVLVNLAINAQQAMGEERGELRVRTRSDGGQVIIEVQDTGPGMAPEVQARIFEPFFSTKPAGQGTGLGLSVSYGIIEAHGGRIEVRSSAGEGATFLISLPAAVVEQSEAAA
jgi:signal transduction histidine kinase